ncbi:MAG: prephenate dehydratase domain-containing protein, partial [Halanaerobiales bacterium]
MSSKVKNSGKKNYGYLGPPGTFSEMAALKYTDSCDKIIPYKTIREVVEKVNKGEIKRGIIPLENSQEGSVNVSLDLLLNKSNLKIIGEVIIPIEHYLMAPP